MARLAFEDLIKVVLMVLAVAVVIGGAYLFYINFLVPQTKSDFSAQSSAVQASIQAQASSFVSNLEACKAKTADACMCRNALVNLPKEVSVQINNKGTQSSPYAAINFMFNGKGFREGNINGIFVSAVYASGDKVTEQNFGTTETYLTLLNFEKMEFNGEKIISNSVYKRGLKLYFIVYKSKTLLLIGISEKTQKAVFDKLPVC
jgi:hypothetical protein